MKLPILSIVDKLYIPELVIKGSCNNDCILLNSCVYRCKSIGESICSYQGFNKHDILVKDEDGIVVRANWYFTKSISGLYVAKYYLNKTKNYVNKTGK